MLMQTFDNNFGQVEDDESMKSEDAKFGFGNTSQNQIMDDEQRREDNFNSEAGFGDDLFNQD